MLPVWFDWIVASQSWIGGCAWPLVVQKDATMHWLARFIDGAFTTAEAEQHRPQEREQKIHSDSLEQTSLIHAFGHHDAGGIRRAT